jgi:hypothetical protein
LLPAIFEFCIIKIRPNSISEFWGGSIEFQ